MISVQTLVIYRGTNALAICLNTVAVLFLVELDNLAFSHGLRENMRVEAEEFGRISVTDDDSRLIDVIKLVCMLTVPAAILGGVAAGESGVEFALLPVPLVVMVQSVLRAPAGKAGQPRAQQGSTAGSRGIDHPGCSAVQPLWGRCAAAVRRCAGAVQALCGRGAGSGLLFFRRWAR